MNKSTLRLAFRASLPVLAGYLVLGIGFGVLLEAKGYGFLWAFLMSFTIYAGSMQYAALDLISGGASLITTALMTLMVNARHFFYGISMLDKYKGTGKKKPYLIFSLTDETYSLVCDQVPEGVDRHRYYLYVSVLNQSYWIMGSVLGGLLGAILPFDTTGMDFAMSALFMVIVVEQWRSTREHLPTLVGFSMAILCLVIFGPDRFVIPAMVAITLCFWLLRKRLEVPEDA